MMCPRLRRFPDLMQFVKWRRGFVMGKCFAVTWLAEGDGGEKGPLLT